MDLVTLAEYKAYKNMGSNPVKDGVHQTTISAVSNLIKMYCGRTFIDHYSTPKTEVFSIKKGVNAVVLNETPLGIVSAVNSNGVDITDSIGIDTDNGIIYSNPDYYADEFFTTGVDALSITYLGGYEEAPADIKLACLELVDYYVNGEHKTRQTFGGSTVEYAQVANSWPYHIKSILDMYRDV